MAGEFSMFRINAEKARKIAVRKKQNTYIKQKIENIQWNLLKFRDFTGMQIAVRKSAKHGENSLWFEDVYIDLISELVEDGYEVAIYKNDNGFLSGLISWKNNTQGKLIDIQLALLQMGMSIRTEKNEENEDYEDDEDDEWS